MLEFTAAVTCAAWARTIIVSLGCVLVPTPSKPVFQLELGPSIVPLVFHSLCRNVRSIACITGIACVTDMATSSANCRTAMHVTAHELEQGDTFEAQFEQSEIGQTLAVHGRRYTFLDDAYNI